MHVLQPLLAHATPQLQLLQLTADICQHLNDALAFEDDGDVEEDAAAVHAGVCTLVAATAAQCRIVCTDEDDRNDLATLIAATLGTSNVQQRVVVSDEAVAPPAFDV